MGGRRANDPNLTPVHHGLNVNDVRAAPSGAAGCYTVRRRSPAPTERPRQHRPPNSVKGARPASHQGLMEPDTRAPSSSSKRPRAAARKTTFDETDTDLQQTQPDVQRSPMRSDRNCKHAPTRRSNPSAGTTRREE